MKKKYIKPAIVVEEIVFTSYMYTTSRVPIEEEPAIPAARDRRGKWGNLWWEEGE